MENNQNENLLESKIELLKDQIENIERSGFFTEKEIDTLSRPMNEELKTLKELNQHKQLSAL